MPVITTGDTVLVTIVGRLCGQRTLNTFPYRVAAASGGDEQSDVFTAFHASLGAAGELRPAFRGCTPENYDLDAMWYQIIRPVRFRKYVANVGVAGLFLSTAYTGNVQASVTRVGSVAERKSVGGIRVPIGTDANSTVDGSVTNALKAQLTTLANAMKRTIITVGFVTTFIPLVGVARLPGPFRDVYDAFAQDTTRVQRRRTVGLGI